MMVKAMVSRVAWLAASLVALGGCVTETASDEVDTAEEGVTGAEDAAEAPPAAVAEREGRQERGKDRGAFKGMGGAHAKMRGGPEHLLGLAMKELELTDAQRGALEDAMKSVHAPPGDKADHEAKAAELAAAVRAGKVDPAALRPAGEPGAEHADRMERVASALQTLHATLTPEQRSELVAKAVELRAEHDARGQQDQGPKDNDHGKAGRRGPGEGGPLGHMLRDAELTEEQRQKIDAALEAKGLGKPKSPPDADELAAMHAARAQAASAMLDAFAQRSLRRGEGARGAQAGEAGPTLGRLRSWRSSRRSSPSSTPSSARRSPPRSRAVRREALGSRACSASAAGRAADVGAEPLLRSVPMEPEEGPCSVVYIEDDERSRASPRATSSRTG
jgi:Spy/CpxP family protein refolding chaperone